MARSRISVRAFLIPSLLLLLGTLMIAIPLSFIHDLFPAAWADQVLPGLFGASFVINILVAFVLCASGGKRWLLLCYPLVTVLYALWYWSVVGESPLPPVLWTMAVILFTAPMGGGLALALLASRMLMDQTRIAWISKTA